MLSIEKPFRGLACVAAMLAIAFLSGCSGDRCDVSVYTSVDRIFSEPAFQSFEKQTGLKVCASFESYETKSVGALSRLLREAASPEADVFWADDPVRPFLLAKRGLLEPYRSPQAEGIPDTYKDPGGLWTGVAAQARVLLVNTKLVPKDKLPTSIKSLVDPRWKGRVAIGNPLQGTTTVHLAELAAHWGDEKMQAFLKDMRSNEVRLASSSWEVKQLVETGKAAIGLTNTDHAFESLSSGAPVAVVYPDQEAKGLGALVLPTSVVMIRGGPHPENAKRLIDHLVSPAVEAALTRGDTYLPLRAGGAALKGMRAIDDIRPMSLEPSKASDSLERMQPWIRSTFGL